MSGRKGRVGRRQFLEKLGALAGVAAAEPRLAVASGGAPKAMAGAEGLALVADPDDRVASSPAAQEAARRLREACASHGLAIRACRSLAEVRPAELAIVAGSGASKTVRGALDAIKVGRLETPESLALAPVRLHGRDALLAAASDALGLAYALTELADRVELSEEPLRELRSLERGVERPTCRIRGTMRLFASNVEDLGWYHDRSFWPAYFDMLVSHRFNRFNLALGLGYDFARRLRDSYFYFPYPFLLAVPGYDVRASGLGDEERERNLDTLRYIGAQATRRGLHFQLGLWTHAYQWTDSPDVNYTISGLGPATHAAYCRDALTALLQACPGIHGLTLRTHGESGVPEGDAERYAFWRTLMSGIVRAGRPLEIDLHAKGVDQRIIDIALETGLPVRVSPKFWAEHMGLPYLQSSIRALELPREDRQDPLMSLSTGSRNHMRYSYGDVLRDDRRYSVLHRVWPGTQRLLLWGDRAYAAGMGRAFGAHGADGVEYIEPLSFKGRKGSGLPGGRDAYRDLSLRAGPGDWRKYEYTYRLWGRLAYAPEASPEPWRRLLRREHGEAAEALESGLARASRILPLVTSAHCPSAANNNFWPEMYSNMSLVDEAHPGSYSDTPAPKVFGAVSSLDPQLFASVSEYAAALVRGEALAKVTPVEVARQLDAWAESSAGDLARADASARDRSAPRHRRIAVDCAIAAGLGRFFARKLRAGVLFELFDRTGDARAREAALAQYREARAVWADFAVGPAQAYVTDVTFGFDPHLRGHWQDRLAAIDRDIAAVEARREPRARADMGAASLERAVAAVSSPPPAPAAAAEHAAPLGFQPGEEVPLLLRAAGAEAVRLFYRHLNQAEAWSEQEMTRDGDDWRAAVPADYTRAPYALQYYFVLRAAAGVVLWPGFQADFTGQPYVVVGRRA
jgi:hypothetical protein